MSKQGKHVAISCLALAGPELLRGCPKSESHHGSIPTPALPLGQFTSAVHLDFLYRSSTSWFHLPAWMKDPQCYTPKHFDYPKVSQGWGFFDFFIFLQSKTVHFILNRVVPSRFFFKKKRKRQHVRKKNWEFWNNFKIFKVIERDWESFYFHTRSCPLSDIHQ